MLLDNADEHKACMVPFCHNCREQVILTDEEFAFSVNANQSPNHISHLDMLTTITTNGNAIPKHARKTLLKLYTHCNHLHEKIRLIPVENRHNMAFILVKLIYVMFIILGGVGICSASWIFDRYIIGNCHNSHRVSHIPWMAQISAAFEIAAYGAYWRHAEIYSYVNP